MRHQPKSAPGRPTFPPRGRRGRAQIKPRAPARRRRHPRRVGAASCCVIPFALFLAGVSGAWIGNLTALEPYQPIFAGVSLAFIGYGACASGESGRWHARTVTAPRRNRTGSRNRAPDGGDAGRVRRRVSLCRALLPLKTPASGDRFHGHPWPDRSVIRSHILSKERTMS